MKSGWFLSHGYVFSAGRPKLGAGLDSEFNRVTIFRDVNPSLNISNRGKYLLPEIKCKKKHGQQLLKKPGKN